VIWDLATNSERVRSTLPEGFEPETALYADNGVVWLGGSQRDGGSQRYMATVLKVDANSGEVLDSAMHGDSIDDSVTALALSADGKTLATGGTDRRIRLWNTETLEGSDDLFTGHREFITGIVFTDGGATLISSDLAGEVLMWDVSLRRQFGALLGPSDGLNSLEISGEVLLAAGEDDAIWTWILDRAVWREQACLLAGRNMTQAEWDRYGDGSAMVRHCAMWPFTGTGDGRVPEYNEQLTD